MSAQAEAMTVIQSLTNVIASQMTKPVLLRAEYRDGRLEINQIEFLTVEEFAKMVKVEMRTVYLWIEKRMISFYKPKGTNQNLIALSDALAWLESGKVSSVEK